MPDMVPFKYNFQGAFYIHTLATCGILLIIAQITAIIGHYSAKTPIIGRKTTKMTKNKPK